LPVTVFMIALGASGQLELYSQRKQEPFVDKKSPEIAEFERLSYRAEKVEQQGTKLAELLARRNRNRKRRDRK
jgi:hypothetical protein